MSFPNLTHFAASEFRHPEAMEQTFLVWLDAVRDSSGIPFHLTSDFRTPQENAAASGSSPASLHLQGIAVDFVTDASKAKNKQGWREDLWRIVYAVCTTPTPNGRNVQLELTQGEHDWHVHLALRKPGDPVPSSLSLTVD